MRLTFVVDGYDNVPEAQQELLRESLHEMGFLLLNSHGFEVSSVVCYKRLGFREIDSIRREPIIDYERIYYEKKKKKKA